MSNDTNQPLIILPEPQPAPEEKKVQMQVLDKKNQLAPQIRLSPTKIRITVAPEVSDEAVQQLKSYAAKLYLEVQEHGWPTPAIVYAKFALHEKLGTSVCLLFHQGKRFAAVMDGQVNFGDAEPTPTEESRIQLATMDEIQAVNRSNPDQVAQQIQSTRG